MVRIPTDAFHEHEGGNRSAGRRRRTRRARAGAVVWVGQVVGASREPARLQEVGMEASGGLALEIKFTHQEPYELVEVGWADEGTPVGWMGMKRLSVKNQWIAAREAALYSKEEQPAAALVRAAKAVRDCESRAEYMERAEIAAGWPAARWGRLVRRALAAKRRAFRHALARRACMTSGGAKGEQQTPLDVNGVCRAALEDGAAQREQLQGRMRPGLRVAERWPDLVGPGLVGRRVGIMWNGFGWCEGTVVRETTGSGERAKGLNYVVHSDGDRYPYTAKLVEQNYGRDKEWVLIDEAGEPWEEREPEAVEAAESDSDSDEGDMSLTALRARPPLPNPRAPGQEGVGEDSRAGAGSAAISAGAAQGVETSLGRRPEPEHVVAGGRRGTEEPAGRELRRAREPYRRLDERKPRWPMEDEGVPCLTNPEVRAVRNGALETGPVSWVQAPNPGFRSEPGVQAPFLGIRSRF